MATRKTSKTSALDLQNGLGLPRSQFQDETLEYVAVVKAGAYPSASKQIQRTLDADLAGRIVEPPLDPERLLMLYEENAVHASCINAKATDATGQGWGLESESRTDGAPSEEDEEDEEGEGTDLEEESDSERESASHIEEVTAKLSKKLEDITPDLTFDELLEQAAREQEAVGWSAWEVVRDDSTPPPTSETSKLGEITALFPLPAHTLRVSKDQELIAQVRGGKTVWFKKFGSRKNIDSRNGLEFDARQVADAQEAGFLANEVIIFKTYSPRSAWYGIPRWISGIPTIAELTAIREYNISWHASGGTTDRIIHVRAKQKTVAQATANSIREQLEAAKGQGHVTLITSGTEDVEVTVEELSKGQTGKREGQFQDRRGDLIKELLMAHQTPPYRVGWAEIGALGGSAAKEMLRAYREGAIEPLQVVMESRLNQTLFGPDGLNLQGFRFRLEELGWDMVEFETERASKLVENAVWSPNDAREALGEDRSDVEGMNGYYMKGQPLGSTGAVEEERASTLERFTEALRLSTSGIIEDRKRKGFVFPNDDGEDE